MGWTDERVDLLKKFCQDGLSASQISKQLGGRSQVARPGRLGRADPMGGHGGERPAGLDGMSVDQLHAPSAPGFAAEAWVRSPDDVMGRVFADPTTGKVLGATTYFNVQRFFRSLHMSLFIGEWRVWGIPFGYLVVGLLSLPLLVQLVTGLVFYRRFWRGLFKLEQRRGPKVFWSDLHKLTGLWGLWLVLTIGLTGVWYLAEWKITSEPPAPDPPAAEGTVTDRLPLDQLAARARVAYPQLTIREVALYESSGGMVAFHGQDGSLLLRDRAARVWLDGRTGEVLGIRRPGEMSPLHRWIDTADPLALRNLRGFAY